MKKQVGLWIDHRKTVIVTLENGAEEIRTIESDMEKHIRFSKGTGAKGNDNSQGPNSEDVRDRQFGNHLDHYYEEIISLIRDADSIWIIGPGEAKVELENRLKHDALGASIAGVETDDKLTDHQIAAKVREHFHN